MNVLVCCEESQRVCAAFINRGIALAMAEQWG